MSLPRGARARPAIRKETIPKGMPMIVQHRSTPVMTCSMAIQSPARTNHKILTIMLAAPAPGRLTTERPKRPDHVGGQSPRSDAERSSDHQKDHDHSCERVADREPQASDAEPEDVADGLHKRQHGTCVVDEALFGEGRVEDRRAPLTWTRSRVGSTGRLLAIATIVPYPDPASAIARPLSLIHISEP